MENQVDLESKIRDFEKDQSIKRHIEEGWKKHTEFLKCYPFREHPEQINNLSPQDIYNPGEKYFFDWIEHKLKALGHLSVGSAKVWENARDNVEILKELLKVVINDSLSISQKIDSHWEDIKGFGGDRHIAKKILFCYYPEKIISAYKTEDLEDLAEALNSEYREKSREKYKEEYDILSIGQKFELFNDLLFSFKNQHPKLKKMDNALFGNFLYKSYPISRILDKGTNKPSPRKVIKPFSSFGLIAEPKYEQEVVFLFSKFHIKLGFPIITKIAPAFPDAEAIDEKGKYKKIEFEVLSSDFIGHGHNAKECDYIICWEDDLTEEQKKCKELPQVISLKEELGE